MKTNKRLSVLLIFILLFQLLFSNLFLTLQTGAEATEKVESISTETEFTDEEGVSSTIDERDENETVESVVTSNGEVVQSNATRNLGNIFKFLSLKVGEEVFTETALITITEDTEAVLHFTWDTETLNAKNGDVASIEMAEAFEIITTPRLPLIVEGTNVGTYHIESGVLTFEFNEGIESSDVSNGWVELGLKFNLDKFRENNEQQIPFRDSSENSITVIARPNTNHSGINKQGHPDTKHDAREIIWTIDVLNTNDEEIGEATLKDVVPAGLGEARDFIIHELSVGFDGDLRVGNNVTSAFNPTKFPLEFSSIARFTGYRVQYKTTIENYALASFKNNATFEYDKVSLSADATVGGITRSNPIEKNGEKVEGADSIHWQIDVNKNGSIISEAIIRDDLPSGLTIEPNSVEVVRMIQNGDNWSEGDSHDISFSEFPINLGALGQDDAYRIKFLTNVDWSKVNDGVYERNNGFQNITTLFDGEDELNADDATVSIQRDPIVRKTGTSNVNYDNKTVTWTIDVNEAGHPIGEAILTDLIPEGLAITKDDIVITSGEVPYTPGNISIDSNAENGTKVVIDLGNVGTQKLQVKYTTTITDFTINEFNNTVEMKGVGIGPEGEHSNESIKPVDNTYNKHFTGINYNKKTIDWRLNVNPIREGINSGFVISDTYTNDGLILLPETVVIQLGNETLEAEDDYILKPIDNGYQDGFTITFKEKIADQELVVSFSTSYDPQLSVDGEFLIQHSNEVENRLYRNKAKFEGVTENGNLIEVEGHANYEVSEDSWNSGKKTGQLVHFNNESDLKEGWISGGERKVAWQLYFNYQKQNLGTGVIVTDKLDYDGVIDEDSIKLSIYNVSSDGRTDISGTILDQGEDIYSIKIEGDEFILTFAENFVVDERYVVEFTTSVPDISKESYTNNAVVNVAGVEYKYSSTVHYNKHNNFLNKAAVNSTNNQVFTGDEVNWRATVNESLSIVNDAIITDTISDGHVYLLDTLNVFKAHDKVNALEEGVDYELEVIAITDLNGEITGETNLVITLSETLEDTLVLEYTTVVTKTEGNIRNSISLNGQSLAQESSEAPILWARQFSNAGGEWAWNSERGGLSVTKVDAETGETITNNEATFTLWYDLNDSRVQFGTEEYTTDKGILEIINLPFRTYYLREVVPPKGYVLSEAGVGDLEIIVNSPVGSENNPSFAEGIFENTKEKIKVTGTKIWENGPQPEIELQLFRNGVAHRDAVTLATGVTKYEWTELDKTDIDGKEYTYTIDEVAVPANYVKSISEDKLTITNRFVTPLIDIPVEKVWQDENNQDGIRPDTIEVELLANGLETDYDNLVLNAANNWASEFTDLPKLDNSGEEINYTIVEIDVLDVYDSEVNGSISEGFTIINSYTPETIKITGKKTWDDANDQDRIRPESITVNLLANGEQVDSIKVTEVDNWSYSFTDFPKYNAGEEIVYTITENTVEHYSPSIAGFDLTNAYTPDETTVTVTKFWDDANNQDGKRSETAEIQLFANGNEYGEPIRLSDDNNWTHTWIELPLNDAGQEIAYTVQELNVHEDYTVEINDENLGNVIITNSYEPELIEVTITKEWLDEADLAGFRPNYIEVELYEDNLATGKVVAIVADEEGVWEGSFINLPKYRDEGTVIEYTIVEVSLDEELYQVDIVPGEPDQAGNVYEFTLINTHEVEYMTVSGTKTWNDANNQDGIRPNTITVNLLANGEQVDSIEVTEVDNWSYSFTDLPVYRAGEEITYTVTENSVNDYSTEIEGFDIKNNYTPGQTSVTVTKYWDDENDQDGVRPVSIKVQLTADDEPLRDPVELSLANNWSHTWTELPVNAAGKPISYSVVEVTELAEYYVEVNDEDHGNIIIVNSYTPESIDIYGTKTWDDVANQDGIRPDTITVNLFANDVLINSAIVSAEDNWEYSFTDLAKYEAGEEIAYSITEDEVEGYETVINEFEITNSYTPEVIEISGSKTWVDADNEKATRPDSIKVNLFADGEQVDSIDVSATDDWNYSFVNLPKYQSGKLIDYSITEESVAGYETTIDGFNITNTLKPIEEEPTNELDPSDDPDDSILSEGTKIPETATSIYNLFMIGAVFLVGGLALLLILRKRSITN